jgi:hypothetical protein
MPLLIQMNQSFPLFIIQMILAILESFSTTQINQDSKSFTLMAWAFELNQVYPCESILEFCLKNPNKLFDSFIQVYTSHDSSLYSIASRHSTLASSAPKVALSNHALLNKWANFVALIEDMEGDSQDNTTEKPIESKNGWYMFPINDWKPCQLGLTSDNYPSKLEFIQNITSIPTSNEIKSNAFEPSIHLEPFDDTVISPCSIVPMTITSGWL